MANEAFARVKIDQLLKDTAWSLTDGRSVRYEYPLDDGGKADYVLFDRLGRALAVLEAKSTSVSLSSGEAQGRRYAELLDVPFIFLSNGDEVWFRDRDQDAHFRRVETLFTQDDLARRKAARGVRKSPLDIPIDTRIAGGGGRVHQSACIEAICRAMVSGRRKMLVEMATGTGKTRTAAALLKRLFDASFATRALFVVDRNTLNIRHTGDPDCVKRDLRREDAVLAALVFVGLSACAMIFVTTGYDRFTYKETNKLADRGGK